MREYQYISFFRHPTDTRPFSFDKEYYGALVELQRAWFAEYGSRLDRSRIETEVNDSLALSYVGVIFAREQRGNIVGYSTLEKDEDPHVLEYGSAFVREDHRRHGVFKGMTEEIFQVARSIGARVLYAYPSTNGPHIPSMVRKGFSIVDTSAYGDVTLKKDL